MSFQTVNVMLGKSFLLNCQIFFVTLLLALPLGLIVSFGSISRWKPLSGVSQAVCLSDALHPTDAPAGHCILFARFFESWTYASQDDGCLSGLCA